MIKSRYDDYQFKFCYLCIMAMLGYVSEVMGGTLLGHWSIVIPHGPIPTMTSTQ